MEKPANEMETICFVRSSGFPTGQPLYKLFNMLMYNVMSYIMLVGFTGDHPFAKSKTYVATKRIVVV